MTQELPPARVAAVLAVLAERQRQDRLHGFHPRRPLGFGSWWARALDKVLHWLNERARRRGRITWALVLAEEFFEVLAARSVSEAVKELRELAALGVKVEEALVAAGHFTPAGFYGERPTPYHEVVLHALPGTTPPSLTGRPSVDAFRQYAARFPALAERTAADCQAIMGAMELALLLGANADLLRAIEQPEALAQQMARQRGTCRWCGGTGLRALPCAGPGLQPCGEKSCLGCQKHKGYCACMAGGQLALADAGSEAVALDRMQEHVSQQLKEWAAGRDIPATEDMLKLVQHLVDTTVSLHPAVAARFGYFASLSPRGLHVFMYRRHEAH